MIYATTIFLTKCILQKLIKNVNIFLNKIIHFFYFEEFQPLNIQNEQ